MGRLTNDKTATEWKEFGTFYIDQRDAGADYVVPYSSGKTMSQMLGDIGACHGGNWIITEENLLRLVPLTTAPDETFHVIDEDYNKITLADGAGSQPVRQAYKEQTVFNAVLPVPSGILPGGSDNVQRSYFITDEKGNKIVTPEGYRRCLGQGNCIFSFQCI